MDEALFGFRIAREIRREKLESYRAVKPEVLGLVDHAHPSTPQVFEDPVVGNGGTDEGRHSSSFSLGQDRMLFGWKVVGVGSKTRILDQGPAAAIPQAGEAIERQNGVWREYASGNTK